MHQAERILLHVGCGPRSDKKLPSRFYEGAWREIRYDIDPATAPDVVGSIADLRAFGDGQVDAIWSSHNLEHLYPHEVPVALREFARVLKPGGFLLAVMPDLQAVAAFVAADRLDEPVYYAPIGPVSAHDMLFGHRASVAAGHTYMAHRTGFTQRSLATALQTAGFAAIQVQVMTDTIELGCYAERPQDAMSVGGGA
jgi:SAM-dependent methyltransferase